VLVLGTTGLVGAAAVSVPRHYPGAAGSAAPPAYVHPVLRSPGTPRVHAHPSLPRHARAR
jgi:hypothetical protein